MFRNLILLTIVGLVLGVLLADFTNAQDNVVEVDRRARFILSVLRNKKPVVVFFYSKSNCNACNWSLIPMLKKMASRKADSIVLALLDLDVLDIQGEQGITTIPTTRSYFNGDIVSETEGTSWGPIVKLAIQATKLQRA